MNPNNRTCDDIDECEVHKSYRLCVGLCDNIPGSYRCACPEGYRIGADSRSCEGNRNLFCSRGNAENENSQILTSARIHRQFAEDMMTFVLICEAHIGAFPSIVHMDI